MKVIEISHDISQIDIEDINLDSDYMYWITASPEEVEEYNDIFNFHSITMHECFDSKQNARLEFFDNYDFLVLNMIEFKDSVISSKEIDIFIGHNYIITVIKDEIQLLSELMEELTDFKQNVIFKSDRSVVKILYYILDKIIFNDYEIMSSLENTADSIEIKILKNPDKRYLNQLIHLRKQVHRLRNYLTPMRYVGDNLICNDNKIISEEYLRYFEQINNRIEKLINSLDSLVQYLVLVREAFEAEIANKTNELMKLFTIIATIFLPLTLITGLFGMNFENMEILTYRWGFHITVVTMVLIAAGLFILFKRKKWL